jgi:hypothetical protein
MAKWQNGKMAKWQNGKMAKWQVDEQVNKLNSKLRSRQRDIMTK